MGNKRTQEKFNHQNLLQALNSAHNDDSLDALFHIHKFNDHNLRQIDNKEQLRQKLAAVAVNRVHRTSLSLAAIHFKLGHLDASLEAVQEAIRIAQNKNDYETILDSTVWLY